MSKVETYERVCCNQGYHIYWHIRSIQEEFKVPGRTGGIFSKPEFIPVNIYILTTKISQSMVSSAAIHTGIEGHLLKLS